jgi:hypothetical protein
MKTLGRRGTLLVTTAGMLAAAASVYVAAVTAQTITNGGLTGQLVSRGARVSGSSEVTLLTGPLHSFLHPHPGLFHHGGRNESAV